MVVEDVALNQLLIKIILSDFKFEYEIVGNGKMAIEKLASALLSTHLYDIILMDLHMPEMNGFEATEYIRKTMKSEIPIIALTADVSLCKEKRLMDNFRRCRRIKNAEGLSQRIQKQKRFTGLLFKS